MLLNPEVSLGYKLPSYWYICAICEQRNVAEVKGHDVNKYRETIGGDETITGSQCERWASVRMGRRKPRSFVPKDQ